jgi:hypothetical protein
MQFEYCRQLPSKTNDKYYFIDMYYMYVFSLTVKNRYRTMTSGNREKKKQENTQSFIYLHNG